MAKDPAFLFYTSDFLTGTVFMTNEEVGIYIRLLCAQHQHGGFVRKEAFEAAVGSHKIIREKFIETENGFFNKRLSEVMLLRAEKALTLSKNAFIRWKQCKSNANASNLDMQIETETEDRGSKESVRGKEGSAPPPTEYVHTFPFAEIELFFKDMGSTAEAAQTFWNHWESVGWKSSGSLITNWVPKARNWILNDHKKQKQEEAKNVRTETLSERADRILTAARKQVQKNPV